MSSKIKDKFITCEVCRKRYTINYTSSENQKVTKCPYCGKHNTTKLNKKK